MSSYDTALICSNGHLICSSVENYPDDLQNFCSKCGAETIECCPSCKKNLRGFYNSDDGYIKPVTVESFCFNCGKPYPWTTSMLETMELLIQEDDDLQEQQKTSLIESLPDIIVETPKTKLALARMQKGLIAAGKFTAEGIRQFVIDFGCELAKKSLNL